MHLFDRIFGNQRTWHRYPYSVDPAERRGQIWDNLQKGILLEERNVFIPWETQYKSMGKYAQKRTDSGDRTIWYLGEQKVLNGLASHLQVLKWSYQPDNSSFDQCADNLGFDKDGNARFLDRIRHISHLFGDPTMSELKKFGAFDIGEVRWDLGKVCISVVGFEMFNCRYSFKIGLIDHSHDRDRKKIMDELIAKGWTEEDLGK